MDAGGGSSLTPFGCDLWIDKFSLECAGEENFSDIDVDCGDFVWRVFLGCGGDEFLGHFLEMQG